MRFIRLILVMGVTLVLMFLAVRNAHAKQHELVALTGCVEVAPVQPSCQPATPMVLR
ncbi:MAG: hypothetical protein H7210_04680 [Pyrinomonadaceae bacterium]|nr:hypothetical protein [Phycisphaerales bacterium]